MALPKFTGVFDNGHFEIEEWFVEQLAEFTIKRRKQLLQDILPALEYLPIAEGWSQITGGVIRGEDPVFYSIEYLNQQDELPLLLDIVAISCDDYLDFILDNNTIEYHAQRNQNGV
tara:strand:- start:92 stop:439 length:348 start_codon:yes stop_codon:yes gene_type:complete